MELLDRLIQIFIQNGYIAVFIALMICGLGLPLPEDVVLVSSGVIAGQGFANVHAMFALSMFGVLLGDSMIFLLGHHYGERIMRYRLVARVLTPDRHAAVQDKFQRYGNRLLFFARFLPGMRVPIYVTAGITHRVSLLRFIMIDALAALISVPLWVYLGFFGANNYQWLVTWVRRSQHGILLMIMLVVLALLILWWKQRQRTNHR